MTDAPDHFWDFMEDGDFTKFTDRERQMTETLADKIVNSFRWLVHITYNDGTPGHVFAFEELDEISAIVERGPDWNKIHKIIVTLNRPTKDIAAEAFNKYRESKWGAYDPYPLEAFTHFLAGFEASRK